uniref:40S ribosomal protein S30 n=1 Tax=Neovison vison TaxID=452646 RepID=A0A8C7C1Q9_NEOVI
EVHGSLACTGKGRRKTPNVANQERKKTGRTKRQMQDNWHSVNVVPAFGKIKGPNANS